MAGPGHALWSQRRGLPHARLAPGRLDATRRHVDHAQNSTDRNVTRWSEVHLCVRARIGIDTNWKVVQSMSSTSGEAFQSATHGARRRGTGGRAPPDAEVCSGWCKRYLDNESGKPSPGDIDRGPSWAYCWSEADVVALIAFPTAAAAKDEAAVQHSISLSTYGFPVLGVPSGEGGVVLGDEVGYQFGQ